MDFYERALYNQILASQEPTQGMMIYFAPLKPGHFKTYNTPEDSFWCCTGTGMENHAKYGDTIYFHGENSLFRQSLHRFGGGVAGKGPVAAAGNPVPHTGHSLLEAEVPKAASPGDQDPLPRLAQPGMTLLD